MTTMLTSGAAGEVSDEDDVDSLTIGRRIRQLRTERGMTLEELAAAVDRVPSQLSMIENGRREPKLTLLQAIARALGSSLDAILESEPLDERSGIRPKALLLWLHGIGGADCEYHTVDRSESEY